MASITSSFGLGSGIDIGSLTEQLVAAERGPIEGRIEAFEAEYDAKITAFGTLKSSVDSFYSKVNALSSQSTFGAKTATSGDEDAFTANAFSTAVAGSYSVNVSTIAQVQTLTTVGFDNITDALGTGTLTFKFGTTTTGPYGFVEDTEQASKQVAITSDDNTLEGIRDKINEADIGVSASIIFNGSQYLLAINSGESGVNNSVSIEVTGDSVGSDIDNTGLSQLAYNASAQQMTQAQAATNASLTINGVPVSSESNAITTAISGVTLNILGATTGAKTLTIANDTTAMQEKIEGLVEEYNNLISTVASMSAYDSEEEIAGLLIGDFTVRNIESRVRSAMTGAISGIDGVFTGLADIGLSTDEENGLISINSTVLSSALSSNFEDIAALFTLDGTPSDANIDFVTATDDTEVGDYAINITQLATKGVYESATGLSFPVTVSAANANKTFSMKVDGVTSNEISLADGVYADGDAIAAEIQAQINSDSKLLAAGVSVTVAYDSGSQRIDITSTEYGSSSKVELTAVDTNLGADFGLTAKVGTTGLNVEGTINGETATGFGQNLTGSSTSETAQAKGLKIKITGGALGDRGTVNFSRGLAAALANTLGEYRGATGLLESRVSDYESRLDDLEEERDTLDLRMERFEERLRLQFIAMDRLVGEYNNTLSFLDQQLGALLGMNDDN